MMLGDVESAIRCRYLYCVTSLYLGIELTSVSKDLVLCIQQSAKYQHVLHSAMAVFRASIHLSGEGGGDEIKSYEELSQIGEQSRNSRLLYNVFMSQIFQNFWSRDYVAVVKLCEKQPPSKYKHILEVMRCFFEGIASMSLARHTHQFKWRVIGEEAVKNMAKLEMINKWTFENKSKLLQAELHYLDGHLNSAEVAYKASIVSAREHKFLHEEALAYELYGIFCMENQMVDQGVEQLNIALDKYKEWGAMKKAEELQHFIDAYGIST